MVKGSDWLKDSLLDPVSQVKVERRATSWLVLANMRLRIRKAGSRGPGSPDDLPSDSSILALSKVTYWTDLCTRPQSVSFSAIRRHKLADMMANLRVPWQLALRPTRRPQESLFDLSCVRVHRTIGSQACEYVRWVTWLTSLLECGARP